MAENLAAIVLRNHYNELMEAIGKPDNLLLHLSAKFYESRFIDSLANASINMKKEDRFRGAQELLDHISLKIDHNLDHNDDLLTQVTDILDKHQAVKEIARNMRMELYITKLNSSVDQQQGSTKGSTVGPSILLDASVVPVWCHQELSFLHYGILPVYRTIKDFNEYKQNNAVLRTDPFYTSDGGYKMALEVVPNGRGSGEGTHVSVAVRLMKGPNDDNLEFPITGIFATEILVLNWKGDNHHIEKSIEFNDDTPAECRERVMTGEVSNQSWGDDNFLPHNNLVDSSSSYSYLNNRDMMSFNISSTLTKTRAPSLEASVCSSRSVSRNPSIKKANELLASETVPGSSERNQQSDIAVSDQQQQHPVRVERQITQKLKALRKTYDDLLFELQKEIVKEIEEKKTTLEEIKCRLESETEFYEDCGIEQISTPDEFFRKLKSPKCCDHFLEPNILETLANKFLPNDGALKAKVNNYVDEVEQFKDIASLNSLRDQLEPLVENCEQMSVKITFKLQKEWDRKCIRLFEILLDVLYPGINYKWYNVKPGSVIVTMIARRRYAGSFKERCIEQREFLMLVGVFNVTLDETEIVFDEPENNVYSFDLALLKASSCGNAKAVEFISEKAQADIEYRKAKSGKTALMIATEHDHVPVVTGLIKAKANVNVFDDGNRSPLTIACQKNHSEIAEELLNAKANADHQDSNGNTALHYAVSHKNVQLSLALLKYTTAKSLITANTAGKTVVSLAFENNLEEVVERLVSQLTSSTPAIPAADLSTVFLSACKLGYSLAISLLADSLDLNASLVVALTKGDVSFLTSLPPESLGSPLHGGVTPLMIASACGQADVVKHLIKAKVDVNCFNKEGLSPICYAVNGRKSLQVMEMLLQAKANPFVKVDKSSLLCQQRLTDGGSAESTMLLLKYAALRLHEQFNSIAKQIGIDVVNQKLSAHTCLQKLIKSPEHPFNYIPNLVGITNCSQLFDYIRPFYDYLSWKLVSSLSFSLLKISYFPLVCQFEASTELAVFKRVTALVPEKPISPNTTDLRLVLDRKWGKVLLCDLRRVVKYLLSIVKSERAGPETNIDYSEVLSALMITADEAGNIVVMYRIPRSQELADRIRSCVSKLRVSAGILGVAQVIVDSKPVSRLNPIYSFSFECSVWSAVTHSDHMNLNELPRLIELLFKLKLNIDPNFKVMGTTALHVAVEKDNLEAVELLLDHNASFDVKSDSGVSPIDIASSPEIRTALLKKAMTVTPITKQCVSSDQQDTISEVCKIDVSSCKPPTQEATPMLNDTSTADLELEDEDNDLLFQACEHGVIEQVKMLLQKGVDPNALNNLVSFTPLMIASLRGRTEIVRLLLQYKADHECLRVSKEGLPFFDAFALACYGDHQETVEAFFNEDITIDNQQLCFGWYVACLYNRRNIIEYLTEYVEFDADEKRIIKACVENDVDYIRERRPANVAIDAFGVTPLMIACSCDSYEVANVLLKAGADKHKKDKFGFTACTYCKYDSPILITLDQKDPEFDPIINKTMICLHPPRDTSP